MEEKPNNSRVVFLDWLRIFAFISVFVGHKFTPFILGFTNNPNNHSTLRSILSFLHPFIHGGGAGVVIFFLVSGYIITQVLEKEKTIEFIVKRFFRIYPLYIVAVAIEAILNHQLNGIAVQPIILIKQMSLMGDFFHTPHALRGVEWTLRIEVLFYIAMAIIKHTGFLNGKLSFALPYVIMGTIISLYLMKPMPGSWSWSFAYINLYAPFLFLGVIYFLLESGRVRTTTCLLATALVIFGYWILIPKWQPGWTNSHFAAYGLGLFIVFWLLRKKILLPAWALLLSELTYSVYLFHNWMYDWLVSLYKFMNFNILFLHLLSTASLFMICWLFHLSIEKPAIRLGKVLVKSFLQQKISLKFK
ncbi:MAG: acyltransferase [Hydrogenophaga sp.]|nr:acyltransferase [Hydrogenophaga sp.]